MKRAAHRFARPPLTIISPTSYSGCYSTTLALVSPSFPRTSIPITLLPTYSSSLLETCPYHFNLLFFIFSYFYVGSMVLWDVSIYAGLAGPPLKILSPTSRSWCYPTTSALVFLSFFSPAPPSPSLFCLRIRLLFSKHAHTTSTYSPALWNT